MKRQTYVLFFFIITLISCSDEHLVLNNDLESEKELKFSMDGEYDLLGFGYDMTGRSFDPNDSRENVIDVERMKKEGVDKKYITPVGVTSSESKLIVGMNRVEITKTQTKKYNFGVTGSGSKDSANYFKGEVSTNPTNTNTLSHSYAAHRVMIAYKRYKFNKDTEFLKNYLTDDFKEDLKTFSGEAIINKYGTHVLLDITLGGKLDIKYSCINQSIFSKKKSSVAASAKFAITASLGINVGYDGVTEESLKKDNINETLFIKSYGGSPNAAILSTINLTAGQGQKVDIDKWVNSCDFENYPQRMLIIDVEPTTGAIPIWEFASSEADKTKLKNALRNYISNRQYKGVVQGLYRHYKNATQRPWCTYLNTSQFIFGNPLSMGICLGDMYSDWVEGTVPLYHFYSPADDDDKYFIDLKYVGSSDQYKGIIGYVYESRSSKANVPVTWYWIKSARCHICNSSITGSTISGSSKGINFYLMTPPNYISW
ncbi:MAG: MAC/perforin domain-containing protein [Dysgonomonas sp.]